MEGLMEIITTNKAVLIPIAGSIGLWVFSEILGELKFVKSNGVLSLIVNTVIKAFQAIAKKSK